MVIVAQIFFKAEVFTAGAATADICHDHARTRQVQLLGNVSLALSQSSQSPSLDCNGQLLILIMRRCHVGMLAVFASRRLAAHQWWANPDHDFSFSSFRFPSILCPFLSSLSFPFFVPSST